MKGGRLGVGTLTIPKAFFRYVKDIARTNRLSYGPFTQAFEKYFSHAHDRRYGVMVNSGTSALRIAVACLKESHSWADGDEVLVPAVTFVATANVVIANGLKPVFVDVDPRTYNIDPAQIEAKLTKRTRAIIPVHLFGQPAEMDRVMCIARRHNLRVIEDSCETMFVDFDGKKAGSFGDIACFSTYVAHLIVTGVGGIAITDNPKHAERLRSLANHGRDGIYFGGQGKELIARRFRFVRPGYSFRVTEFEGALGLAQLPTASDMLQARQRNAAYLSHRLNTFAEFLQLPACHNKAGHAFMMFPIVIRKNAAFRKTELVHFLEARGIETRDMLPLINQPYLRRMYDIDPKAYPVADWINKCGFYIGCHQNMRRRELNYVAEAFHEFFGARV